MPGADPHAITIGQTVWIYPTWGKGGQQFFAFSSTDLQRWQQHGPVLDFADVGWIKDDGWDVYFAWAPSVIERRGVFYFYYAVGPQRQTPARIGVARGDKPAGPFRDAGQPLLTGKKGFEAIDPMVFPDPKSGKYYLYAGGSSGAKLRVFELNEDLLSISHQISTTSPPQFTEGAFMHYANGIYYLSYSHGSWRDTSYSVHYATAPSPTGPWAYQGAILSSDANYKGPGHHSFIQDPANGQWLIVYHRWEKVHGDGPYKGARRIAIERIEYDANGMILPIKMAESWLRD